MTLTLIIILISVVAIYFLGPRPRLDPSVEPSDVPTDLELTELAAWLDKRESQVPDVVPGAEAHIQFANPASPARTDTVFVYIHGFSATWPETAPVTTELASRYNANILQMRVAGHGTGTEGMLVTAEQWLRSLRTQADVALQLGQNLVIIATSTGAPLSVWLATRREMAGRINAMLFMSPNFKIRPRVAYLLTSHWAAHWIPRLFGKYREWVPLNEAQGKYWTTRQPTLSLIEMQKAVDWANTQDYSSFDIPLATMYMHRDPTIDPDAAIAVHERWGASYKKLLPVAVDGDKEEHVFVGDICAPHRNTWCIDTFDDFLRCVITDDIEGSRTPT